MKKTTKSARKILKESLPAPTAGTDRRVPNGIRYGDVIGVQSLEQEGRTDKSVRGGCITERNIRGKGNGFIVETYLLNVDVNRPRRHGLLRLRKRGKVSPVVQKESSR